MNVAVSDNNKNNKTQRYLMKKWSQIKLFMVDILQQTLILKQSIANYLMRMVI